ncbi:MAG: formyltransferase family protein [Thermodesulfobacteriota bacterium]
MTTLAVLFAANWGLGGRLLAALLESPAIRVLGVVTRAAAGGGDPWADVVRQCAAEAGLRIWDEAALDPVALGALARELDADLLWLHAYMRRLPREAFAAPRQGTVNVHGSLLPAYRGPAPHHWVLRNREPMTGLTSHFIDEGLDTGPIIHQVTVPLLGDETLPVLLDRLGDAAAPLVRGTVAKLLDPGFVPVPQDESRATHAPRMEKVHS